MNVNRDDEPRILSLKAMVIDTDFQPGAHYGEWSMIAVMNGAREGGYSSTGWKRSSITFIDCGVELPLRDDRHLVPLRSVIVLHQRLVVLWRC